MPKPHDVYFATFFFIATTSYAWAEPSNHLKIKDDEQKNELWINPGMYSFHYDRNTDFNSVNYGIGVEYKFSNTLSATTGTYRNSYYNQSNYLGVYWQPVSFGPVDIGVVAGGFNGYSNTNNGGWFPALLPVLTIEGKRVGLNVIVIPTIPNQVAGCVSFQLKAKLF